MKPRRPHRQPNRNAGSRRWARKKRRGPPQRTATPTSVGEPGGGADRPAIQHADPSDMEAHGGGEAFTAGQPDTEPEGPMPDTEWEDGLRPRSARGAQPAGRTGAAPLANLAHHADASAPGEAPPRDPGNHTRHAPARSRQGHIAQRTQPRRQLFRCLHGVLHG